MTKPTKYANVAEIRKQGKPYLATKPPTVGSFPPRSGRASGWIAKRLDSYGPEEEPMFFRAESEESIAATASWDAARWKLEKAGTAWLDEAPLREQQAAEEKRRKLLLMLLLLG